MKNQIYFLLSILASTLLLEAQSPEQVVQRTPPSNPTVTPGEQNTTLGKDAPILDPSSEIISWDGKHWNINNQRLFSARFEKYLGSKEETSEDNLSYQKMLTNVLEILSPETKFVKRSLAEMTMEPLQDPGAERGDVSSTNIKILASSKDEALRQALELLPKISEFKQDAQQCSTLADAISSVLMCKGNKSERLLKKNVQLNMQVLAVKVQFQALIVQLFMQRRFQHVLIGTRAYRFLFPDGDTKLSDEFQDLFAKVIGYQASITLGTLDTWANGAIKDVQDGVETYKYHYKRNEMEQATKRLAETFAMGEFLPEIQTLPREEKQSALTFTQKTNKLISAIEVKDYTLAENLVKDLEKTAIDFDNSKPMAAIENARTISKMHLAKAKNAAVSGDSTVVESELKEAAKIWPRNPDLNDVSTIIFSQSDVQQQAIIDLDRLLAEQNFRQIFNDKLRFIAAASQSSIHQKKLAKVLDDFQVLEGSIARSKEFSKRGDYAGAWEGMEKAYKQFPNDNLLNQLRSDLTTKAADFVRPLRTAQELEEGNKIGSSLAWYLEAQRLYPSSELAQEGINRLAKQILPEQ